MKILMISLDGSILDKNSASFGRMVDYGSVCDELHILVLKGTGGRIKVADNVFAYPSGNSRLGAIFSAIKIGTKILSSGGDWVITSQDPFETGFIAWRLSRKFSAPFEVQLHGDFYGNKYWRGENFINRFRFYLGKFILRRADGVRVVSERIKKSISGKNIYKVPIYTEIKKIAERKNQKTEITNLLTVGNLVPVKNHKLLIKAVSEFKNIKLTIVGGGVLRKNLEKTAGRNKNIFFLGYARDVAEFYKSADIFVHPSLYEGWGRAVVEAASFGLPIIMSDVGLAGEVIKNNESGLIVPVNDKKALKDAITKMIEDKALAKRLGEKAREAVAVLPDKQKTLELIKNNWKKLLN
ncbi:MAG: glycosyltransferase family 4 protein [Patescibacteria group bacterium]